MVKPSSPTTAPATPLARPRLNALVRAIRVVLPEARGTLIYGSANNDDHAGDIDLAVIVEEGTDRFDVMRRIAPVLALQIIEDDILTTCFPIEADAFAVENSQFIRNVRSDGRQL